MADKTTKSYWRTRIKKRQYANGRTSTDYQSFPQFDGKRKWIPTGSSNLEIASQIAADNFKRLRAEGWAAFEKEKPERSGENLTVGEFLDGVEAVLRVTPRTWGNYRSGLLQITGEILGLESVGGAAFDRAKHAKWKERVLRASLSILTTQSVSKWAKEYVTRRGTDPVKARKAKTSCNSTLAKAQPLFAPEVLELAGFAGLGNPFAKVKRYESDNTRYESKFDAAKLFEAAKHELGTPRREGEKLTHYVKRAEAFKALAFLVFTGLRMKELDLLMWEQVDFEGRAIVLRRTRYFEPKTESSLAEISLDENAVEILRALRDQNPGDEMVLKGNAPAAKDRTYSQARCKPTFKFLYQWLREYKDEKGNRPLAHAQKPVHTIRKEIGSIVAARLGIYAASSFLRHSEIATTQRFYIGQKNRITAGIKLPE